MRICAPDTVHQVFTNRWLPAALLRALRRRSIRVTLV